jgi:SAM-dependent methyltransferase
MALVANTGGSMGIVGEVVYTLAKRRVLGRSVGSVGENAATFDAQAYAGWRGSELENQFTRHFSASEVRDKDVLDFGCGEGALSIVAARQGARHVVGVDLSASRIERARLAVPPSLANAPEFLHAEHDDRIDLPDACFDVILCFDVLEHVMAYEAIVREWHRVLRSDGRVLVWWVPWWHPYGPHIESLVPIPWAHAVCSDRELIDACARIYDLPDFRPRLWDLDEDGQKKPNKWTCMEALPEVNRLTMRRFEQLCADVGFDAHERSLHGFNSSSLARLTHPLLAVPYVREFFASCVTYRLRKR